MRLLTSITLILFSSAALANPYRPSVKYFAPGSSYKIKNMDANYKLSGFGLDLDYLFGENALLSPDDVNLRWGLGLGYRQVSGKLQQAVFATIPLPEKLSLSLYSARLLLGMTYASFNFEIPLQMGLTTENSGVNQGDQKYGYSYGFHLDYEVMSNMTIGLSYDRYALIKGKNKSTGKSGSLANPVDMGLIGILLAFPFGE